jgi:drug/metabolite transporter (DMT)-like permease
MLTMRNPAYAASALLGLIWGSNFLFMKWAAETITPGQTTLLRVLFGFVPVALYAASRGALSRDHLWHLHHFAVMSVLATSVYYFAFASGAALLTSGIAGALSGAIPLFSLIGAAVLLRSEPVTVVRVLGVLVGFAGVLLIARPWAGGVAVSTTGVLYVIGGSASVGLSFVYAKRFLVDLDIPPAGLTTYQMGLGLITLLAVTDTQGITAITGDLRALAGLVVGLGLLGTGLAYILYYVIVERLGAITASSATYVPPVVALAIGWLLAGEPVAPLDGAAVLLIVAGVVLSARPRRAAVPRLRRTAAAAAAAWPPRDGRGARSATAG